MAGTLFAIKLLCLVAFHFYMFVYILLTCIGSVLFDNVPTWQNFKTCFIYDLQILTNLQIFVKHKYCSSNLYPPDSTIYVCL